MSLFEQIENIHEDLMKEGFYKLAQHGSYLEYDGIKYEYHSSGLCREVFISPDGKSVIKIPVDLYPFNIAHNLLEVKCYQDAPKKYKKYLAKTELLDFGWIRQEYVEVLDPKPKTVYIREIGRTLDGRLVIFDYDPFFATGNYEPEGGFNYEWLPEYFKNQSKILNKT